MHGCNNLQIRKHYYYYLMHYLRRIPQKKTFRME